MVNDSKHIFYLVFHMRNTEYPMISLFYLYKSGSIIKYHCMYENALNTEWMVSPADRSSK